jgi:hypothetical protein
LIQELVTANASNDVAIERIYLAALSRYPSEEEKKSLAAALDAAASTTNGANGGGPPRRTALEDLAWAILTGREFLFTH